VAVESKTYYLLRACVCVLSYWACKTRLFGAEINSHPRRVWLYHIFQHYLINSTTFRKHLFNKICVFWFTLHLLFENFLISWIIRRDIVINVLRLSCKVPVILSDINETLTFILLMWRIGWASNDASKWQMGFNSAFKGLTFLADFRKILRYHNSWKSFQWGRICLMRTDRHDKTNICFPQLFKGA
jgi:hypothetical protein